MPRLLNNSITGKCYVLEAAQHISVCSTCPYFNTASCTGGTALLDLIQPSSINIWNEARLSELVATHSNPNKFVGADAYARGIVASGPIIPYLEHEEPAVLKKYVKFINAYKKMHTRIKRGTLPAAFDTDLSKDGAAFAKTQLYKSYVMVPSGVRYSKFTKYFREPQVYLGTIKSSVGKELVYHMLNYGSVISTSTFELMDSFSRSLTTYFNLRNLRIPANVKRDLMCGNKLRIIHRPVVEKSRLHTRRLVMAKWRTITSSFKVIV